MRFQRKEKYTIDDLLKIMEILRSPEGCPWDRQQTHQSIRNNLIEETYEAVEAIDTADKVLLREELGDVLLQVVFHAQLEKEKGGFDFSDVADGVAKKLIERHPHVFGDVSVRDSEEVLKNWDAIKMRAKGRKTLADVLEGVSPALPALMRSQKLRKKAAKAAGQTIRFQETALGVRDAVRQIEKLPDSAKPEDKMEKVGKLLFSAVGIAESCGIEAEQALAEFCSRFVRQYKTENRG